MIFERKTYLQKLIQAQGNGMIKIITGIRRCGKSFLLFNLFKQYLIEHGTKEDHIIGLSLDDMRNKKLLNPNRLLKYIDTHIVNDGEINFVFLDEVQLVKDFVGVLLSLTHMPNVEAYVSGSNSKFLSKDVVTEFRGRGWEIRVHPLSFAEYYEGVGGDKMEAMHDYYTYGGLPMVAQLATEQEKKQYLQEVYLTIYLRDIIERNHLQNEDGLMAIMRVLASSIGSSFNARRISNTFKTNEHLVISEKTISHYLEHLQDAFIISEAMRYDIKGRRYIGSENKYYFEDIGIRNAITEFRQSDEVSHLMENILYNELRSKGYSVDVGMVETWERNKDGNRVRKQLEVDFVVNRLDERLYIQSAYQMQDQEKKEQEQRPLKNIPDEFKKIIITGEYHDGNYNDDGIYIVGWYNFLLGRKSFNL
jgi:uncharacterized protein